MERIDLTKQYISEAIPATGDGPASHPHEAAGDEASSHWLSSAMAVWVRQDDDQTVADRDIRHADINPR